MRLSATDAWHKAESVMGHIQHLSLESLVKIDHFKRSHQIFPPVPSRRRKQNISRSKGDRAVAQQQSEVNYGDTALLEVRKKRRIGRG
jgi:hypothetical protein